MHKTKQTYGKMYSELNLMNQLHKVQIEEMGVWQMQVQL